MTTEYSKLLELARQAIKRRSLSKKTENAYLNHIGHFLEFHGDCDLSASRADKIENFLNNLKKTCSASTLNQARCALLFFYRDALRQTLSTRLETIERVRAEAKTHIVWTHEESKAILANLRDAPFLAAAMIYGAGLRLAEAVSLRVGDIDFERREIKVREAETGAIQRRTFLPKLIVCALQRHISRVRFQHEDDCLSGFGKTLLPETLLRRNPRAAGEFSWQYLFPAAKLSPDGNGSCYRHHLAESTVQKAVAEAVEKARIKTHGGCQTLRYSFASRLFEQHCDIYLISRLLGHKNVKTTLNYFDRPIGNAVISPLD